MAKTVRKNPGKPFTPSYSPRLLRAQAVAAGVWLTTHGQHVPLTKMVDTHLVNALLKAFEDQDGPEITLPLAREIKRRNLDEYALKLAAKRMAKYRVG